jgi:hypothetical protein
MKATAMTGSSECGGQGFRGWLLGLVAFSIVMVSVEAGAYRGARDGVGGKREVQVATWNVYVGSEFDAVLMLDPGDPDYGEKLVGAVTQTYWTMVMSRPDLRMAAVAAQIAGQLPDVVTLNEVALVRMQSPGDLLAGGTEPATEVDMDYLAILMQALDGAGAKYRVAAVTQEFDLELPMVDMATGMFNDVRLTDRDVILVRSDLPPGYLRVLNADSGHFDVTLPLPSLGAGITRGWCSVDVMVRGRVFRVINAHLEEETVPEVQMAQALEILEGPARVRVPVILAGDFNSDANGVLSTPTYDLLLGGGFVDSWDVVNPGVVGLTWGHDGYLADPSVEFVWRLDYVLYRGGIFDPQSCDIVDSVLPDRGGEPPLWASDHAGVFTVFRVR